MNKAQKIAAFDLNGLAQHPGVYGLPFDSEESLIHLLPVPWEVTVSYGSGTADGPAAILEASRQVDLYDPRYPEGWKSGLFMHPISEEWAAKSVSLREKAETYISALEEGRELSEIAQEINTASQALNQWVDEQVSALLKAGKKVVLVGGDHSTPLGTLRAHKAHHGDFGLLHIDAHADLRPAYEGFTYSHASIMYNALQEGLFTHMVSVGLRDFCHQEAALLKDDPRITAFTDRDLQRGQFEGESWKAQCDRIVAHLPSKVYLSFDIDGLDPALCPTTGTPVAGGFTTEQVIYLVDAVLESGRTLIGFDLVEVAPGPTEWDANVGARLLYALCLRLTQ